MAILKKILKNKLASAGIGLAVLVFGYYAYGAVFGKAAPVRYVLAKVQKGTLISSVNGTGQVSVSNKVDIKAKASGDVIYIGAENGQEVKSGKLLAELDTRDADKAVRDAEVSLESAKIALEKLKNSTYTDANGNLKAADDLKQSIEDGFNTVANAFLDLPTVMSGLNDILFSSTLSTGQQWNIDYYESVAKKYDDNADIFRNNAYNDYQAAKKSYDQNFNDYKSLSRFSDTAEIEKLINETYDTAQAIAQAVKSANNLIQFYQDKLTENNLKPVALSITHLASINTYTGQTNAHLLNLLSVKSAINDKKEALLNAPLDVQTQELAIKQKENALLDAKEKLADYFIRAPFDGVAAVIDLKKGDSVSAGSIAATIITRKKLAEISLNEVDVAKIKIGQKATLTFDAVPGLTIAGEVAEIDAVGTISQGVVTYTVKIAFDTQDDRIKPSMTASADIITDVKTDVLLVPNSSIKTQGENSYVGIVDGPVTVGRPVALSQTPHQQTVQIGISNDEFTEIISGLKEGDVVVMSTINSIKSSSLRIPGLGGGR